MMSQPRPRVFLSSTIYDFADLRSALKFWLEELGHDVDTSETPDFRKNASSNSYEACLQAIDECDIFILLIGGRAGGWVNETAGETITMMEYRRAYERAKRGEVKLLTFVRRAVWNVREDRRGLEKVLRQEDASTAGLGVEQQRDLLEHPSRIVRDARAVFKLLKEVSRADEMRAASRGGGPLPPANWIHNFESFRDIVDTLRVELPSSYGVKRAVLVQNLRSEILRNLAHLLEKADGRLRPGYHWAKPARYALKGEPLGCSTMKAKYVRWLGFFSAFSNRLGSTLSTAALEDALRSGEFLSFDAPTGTHSDSELQKLMQNLLAEMDQLRFASKRDDKKSNARIFELARRVPPEQSMQVPNEWLAFPASLHDRCFNVVALTRALYASLASDRLESPALAPQAIWGEAGETQDNTVPSAIELAEWLRTPVGGPPEVPPCIITSLE